MSGQYNYELVKKAVTGVFGVVSFGVWIAKNFKGVMTEAQDSQPDEIIGLVTQCATVELPKLWNAFQSPAEKPLV